MKQQNIYNEDYSLNSCYFTILKNDYKIISTNGKNNNIKNCTDSVKNLTNGKIKEYKRFELILMFKRYEL